MARSRRRSLPLSNHECWCRDIGNHLETVGYLLFGIWFYGTFAKNVEGPFMVRGEARDHLLLHMYKRTLRSGREQLLYRMGECTPCLRADRRLKRAAWRLARKIDQEIIMTWNARPENMMGAETEIYYVGLVPDYAIA